MMPQKDEILLDEPEVIRHGNKYGVKMKAQALCKPDPGPDRTEIAPIVEASSRQRT